MEIMRELCDVFPSPGLGIRKSPGSNVTKKKNMRTSDLQSTEIKNKKSTAKLSERLQKNKTDYAGFRELSHHSPIELGHKFAWMQLFIIPEKYFALYWSTSMMGDWLLRFHSPINEIHRNNNNKVAKHPPHCVNLILQNSNESSSNYAGKNMLYAGNLCNNAILCDKIENFAPPPE